MPDDDATIRILRRGNATKPDPFTICFVANPALETPWRSGQFSPDPILNDQRLFDEAVDFAVDSLYGNLPGQGEKLFDDPRIRNEVRIVSVFPVGLSAEDANSLVAQDGSSWLIIARRTVVRSFLARFGLDADIVFALSDPEYHDRSSAWATSDDDGRPGVAFILDGVTLHHRHYCLIPGTIALYARDREITPLHEFQHALGSFSNGQIVDLYCDGAIGVNNKRGRPIPASFADYDGTVHASDPARDGLGYPHGWQSYHCELHQTSIPAVMDDFTEAGDGFTCENDTITRRFLLDRIRAKINR